MEENKNFGIVNGKVIALRLNNQDIVDALRNTLTVITPIAVLYYLEFASAAFGIGTGALLICLTDLPGNRSNKLFSAWSSILTFFLIATITAFSNSNKIALPLVAGVLTFLLVMMASFGQRMAAIGSMGLAVVAFTIGLQPANPLEYGIFIVAGGLWYFMVSLALAWLFPYHSLERALSKTRKDTAKMMRLRALGYDANASLTGFNANNIKLHLKLTASHELVRQLLLGDKFNIGFEKATPKRLLKQSIILIDLYEQVSALHYDYISMRKQLQSTGALEFIKRAIEITADRLDGANCNKVEFDDLILKIENIALQSQQNNQLITGILLNLKETGILAFALDDKQELETKMEVDQFSAFLTEGNLSIDKLKSQLNFGSQLYRFALRMSFLMTAVIFLIGYLPNGSYGYWLPITIIVISRPSYGMTMKRNKERIIGTFAGLILGWCILQVNINETVQISLAVLFLFVFFSFLLLRYWVSAMGITLAVVLLLSVYNGFPEQILAERLLFTILGCILGLVATFLFPVRHMLNLKTSVQNAVVTNRDYLFAVLNSIDDSIIDVKLARKRSYLSLSALSETISIVKKEPRWKRKEYRTLKQIELLCFQLNALTAALPLSEFNTKGEQQKALMFDVIEDLDKGLENFSKFHHGNLFAIKSLEKISGELTLANVASKLKAILS